MTLREASRENGWKVPDLSVILQIIIIYGHDSDQNLRRVIHFHINMPIFKMYLLKRFLLSCYPVRHLLQGKVPCLCHGPFRGRILVIAHSHLHLCSKLGQCCFFDWTDELQAQIHLSQQDCNPKQTDRSQRVVKLYPEVFTHCGCDTMLL